MNKTVLWFALLLLLFPYSLLAQTEGAVQFTNRTRFPLRVVVALQANPTQTFYWEFSPQEQAVLQLKGQPLRLTEGDALTAFALNQSTLAWGPLIVGRAPWQRQNEQWVLVLSDKTRPQPPRQPLAPEEPLGELRIGNATDAPLKVLLTKLDGSVNGASWDFAPRKASSEGLPLNLGRGTLAIGVGDVVFIYATDGSRRFWGPNIVGRTPAPFWDAERRFWSTILRP